MRPRMKDYICINLRPMFEFYMVWHLDSEFENKLGLFLIQCP